MPKRGHNAQSRWSDVKLILGEHGQQGLWVKPRTSVTAVKSMRANRKRRLRTRLTYPARFSHTDVAVARTERPGLWRARVARAAHR